MNPQVLCTDGRVITYKQTPPISGELDQGMAWQRLKYCGHSEKPPPVCEQMCALELRQIKKKPTVSALSSGVLPSSSSLWGTLAFFLPFTAPATLGEMNWKITNERLNNHMDMHPTTLIKPLVSCWEPPVGMFTVWRVNSLILSGMFPLGGAV